MGPCVFGLVSQGCGHPFPGMPERATARLACSVAEVRALVPCPLFAIMPWHMADRCLDWQLALPRVNE